MNVCEFQKGGICWRRNFEHFFGPKKVLGPNPTLAQTKEKVEPKPNDPKTDWPKPNGPRTSWPKPKYKKPL